MKKSMIFAMCAFAFAFASCEQNGGNDVPNGDQEKAYVAISLATTDGATKAAGDEFSEGSEDERKVTSAFVLFYKNGNPFRVGSENYKAIALEGNKDSNPESPNVSDYKKAVLVIENYKGEFPNQVVALLNYNPANIAGLSSMPLAQLCETVKDLKTTEGFVMTNSVYVDATGEAVYAYPLTQSNIAMSADAAKNSPVQIYVERTAAKVALTTNATGVVDRKYPLAGTEVPVGDEMKQVYSKVLGWELSNYINSPLIKSIDADWTNDGLHINPWNDAARHRSYWAVPRGDSFAGFEFGATTTWTYDAYKYTGENTNGNAKLVLKCQLQDEAGNALEIARWLGRDYVTRANLLVAVVNNIKYSYYYKDGSDYYQISENDLEAVLGNGTDAEAYETYFKLSPTGETREWYKLTNGAFTAIANSLGTAVADMNAELRKIEPAILYAGGYTYYHTPISHAFYTDGSETKSVDGVVRNHAYSINIKSIAGYGTPINTGIGFIKPETPTEVETFVAAEIKILSWKNVSYDVDIK